MRKHSDVNMRRKSWMRVPNALHGSLQHHEETLWIQRNNGKSTALRRQTNPRPSAGLRFLDSAEQYNLLGPLQEALTNVADIIGKRHRCHILHLEPGKVYHMCCLALLGGMSCHWYGLCCNQRQDLQPQLIVNPPQRNPKNNTT